MILRYSLVFLVFITLFFSCNKKEQSCQDGIFDPKHEEKTDCGGVCPPCDYKPTVVESFIYAEINGKFQHFKDYSLTKNDGFLFQLFNDSTEIRLHFGAIDSLGIYTIQNTNSYVKFKNNFYNDLAKGLVLITDWDKEIPTLSGYFEASFLQDNFFSDTFKIASGEFSKIAY